MSHGIIMMMINEKYHLVVQSVFALILKNTSTRASKVFRMLKMLRTEQRYNFSLNN